MSRCIAAIIHGGTDTKSVTSEIQCTTFFAHTCYLITYTLYMTERKAWDLLNRLRASWTSRPPSLQSLCLFFVTFITWRTLPSKMQCWRFIFEPSWTAKKSAIDSAVKEFLTRGLLALKAPTKWLEWFRTRTPIPVHPLYTWGGGCCHLVVEPGWWKLLFKIVLGKTSCLMRPNSDLALLTNSVGLTNLFW